MRLGGARIVGIELGNQFRGQLCLFIASEQRVKPVIQIETTPHSRMQTAASKNYAYLYTEMTSIFKIDRDLQTFPGFFSHLTAKNQQNRISFTPRKRWMTSNTRQKKTHLLTRQHPHLALQQWSRAGYWQRRARFANLPRCRWPPGKKWKLLKTYPQTPYSPKRNSPKHFQSR